MKLTDLFLDNKNQINRNLFKDNDRLRKIYDNCFFKNENELIYDGLAIFLNQLFKDLGMLSKFKEIFNGYSTEQIHKLIDLQSKHELVDYLFDAVTDSEYLIVNVYDLLSAPSEIENFKLEIESLIDAKYTDEDELRNILIDLILDAKFNVENKDIYSENFSKNAQEEINKLNDYYFDPERLKKLSDVYFSDFHNEFALSKSIDVAHTNTLDGNFDFIMEQVMSSLQNYSFEDIFNFINFDETKEIVNTEIYENIIERVLDTGGVDFEEDAEDIAKNVILSILITGSSVDNLNGVELEASDFYEETEKHLNYLSDIIFSYNFLNTFSRTFKLIANKHEGEKLLSHYLEVYYKIYSDLTDKLNNYSLNDILNLGINFYSSNETDNLNIKTKSYYFAKKEAEATETEKPTIEDDVKLLNKHFESLNTLWIGRDFTVHYFAKEIKGKIYVDVDAGGKRGYPRDAEFVAMDNPPLDLPNGFNYKQPPLNYDLTKMTAKTIKDVDNFYDDRGYTEYEFSGSCLFEIVKN